MSQQPQIAGATQIYTGFIITVVLVLVIIGSAVWYANPEFVSHIKEQVTMKKIHINNKEIYVSVAKTPEQQKEGLTNLTTMPLAEGKLFVFSEAGNYPVWTTGMHFPVDIVWINSDGLVVSIAENVAPDSPSAATPAVSAQYVLLLNAGVIAQDAIQQDTNIDLTKLGI